MKKFQNQLLCIFLLVVISGCSTTMEIGKVNMISTRNIDPKLNYKLLSTYSGSSEKEIKKSKAETIQDAIDLTVKRIPGGEFLMNVTMYKVKDKYYAVQGDVWGAKTESDVVTQKGFKVGDKVTWKRSGKFKTGKITALKNGESCLVKQEEDGKVVEREYTELTKMD